MNIAKTLLLILIISACTQVKSQISKTFNENYFTGLASETPTSYNTVKLDYDLTSLNKKNIHFSDCSHVDKIQASEIAPNEYHLITMLKLNCKALKLYFDAKPAKTSYLDPLLKHHNISELPATAYPYVNNEDYLSRVKKTLQQYQSTLKIQASENGEINVTTETDTLVYQILSTGDFNNDEILDALIRIDWHTTNAFGKGSKLVLISRTSHTLPFIEIKIK